jgi:uncharacterized delta-60 repeat protein
MSQQAFHRSVLSRSQGRHWHTRKTPSGGFYSRPLRFEPLEDRRLLSAGDLDPTFGLHGLVTTDFAGSPDWGQGVAIQADGKIVVAGYSHGAGGYDFVVARHSTDGSLDTSFDGDGKLTTDFGSLYDHAQSVVVQADGKIVVAGNSYNGISSYYDIALARYNTDGSLDTSFSGDGKLTTDFASSDDSADSVAIQADGKIIVAGSSGGDFAVARYNTDGSLDTSLDADGKLTTDFGGSEGDGANSVAIQSDGKVVVAGYRGIDGGNAEFAVARYNTDGSLDTSFAGDGRLTTFFGYGAARSVAIQADGKIVVAGYSFTGSYYSYYSFAVARYNTDGSLDTSFDGDGKLTTDFGSSSHDRASSVKIQADGKIVVAGSKTNRSSSDFAIARYNADGSLDTSLDGDGKLTTDFGSASSDVARSVAIQADGKIVVAGTGYGGGNRDFAVARYQGIDIPAGDYDQNGIVDDGDWTFWKSHFGQTSGLGMAADGNGNGTVDAADYTVWRDNLGRVSGPPDITGDYDRGGVVDDGDYILWKSQFGRSGANWAADGNGDGHVDAADYTVWRDSLGTGAGVGAVVGETEPAAVGETYATVTDNSESLKDETPSPCPLPRGEGSQDKAPSPYPLSATADLRPNGEGFGIRSMPTPVGRAKPQADAAPLDSARVGDAANEAWHRDLALLRLRRVDYGRRDTDVKPLTSRDNRDDRPGDEVEAVDAALADVIGQRAINSRALAATASAVRPRCL